MSKRQLEILQHCCGANKHGIQTGHRNHFCAGEDDEQTCRELVALGLMREHARTAVYPYYNVSATIEGIKAMHEQSEQHAIASRQRQYIDPQLRQGIGSILIPSPLVLVLSRWRRQICRGNCLR